MPTKKQDRIQLFLSWLESNSSRFANQPRVTRHRTDGVDFELQGITAVLKFSFKCGSCAGISVAVVRRGKCLDFLGDFDVAEELTDKGWICRLDLSEEHQYWVTWEDLWTEHCFESFLEWCNNKLANSNWLELYISGGSSSAKLHKNLSDTDQHRDSLKDGCEERLTAVNTRSKKSTAKARYIIVPLRNG